MLRSSIALSQVINLTDLIALDINPICPGNYICVHMMYEMSEHGKGKEVEKDCKFENLSCRLSFNMGYC